MNNRTIVKFAEWAGWLNTVDRKIVQEYLSKTNIPDSNQEARPPTNSHVRPIFSILAIIGLILSFALSKCEGIMVPSIGMQQQSENETHYSHKGIVKSCGSTDMIRQLPSADRARCSS